MKRSEHQDESVLFRHSRALLAISWWHLKNIRKQDRNDRTCGHIFRYILDIHFCLRYPSRSEGVIRLQQYLARITLSRCGERDGCKSRYIPSESNQKATHASASQLTDAGDGCREGDVDVREGKEHNMARPQKGCCLETSSKFSCAPKRGRSKKKGDDDG